MTIFFIKKTSIYRSLCIYNTLNGLLEFGYDLRVRQFVAPGGVSDGCGYVFHSHAYYKHKHQALAMVMRFLQRHGDLYVHDDQYYYSFKVCQLTLFGVYFSIHAIH